MNTEELIEITVSGPDRPALEAFCLAMLREGLCAAASVRADPVTSFYVWDGDEFARCQHDATLRTRRVLFDEVARRLHELHADLLPRCTFVPLEGSSAYLQWVRDNTLTPASVR